MEGGAAKGKGAAVTKAEIRLIEEAVSTAKKRNQLYEIDMEKDVRDIFAIVQNFIKSKRVLCYGGTAINAVLDEEDKFYDEVYDLPDYDFFSTKAMDHARELANIYQRHNYVVNAKAGQHYGTYKVFVNFMPVADITQCNERIFEKMWSEKMTRRDVHYVPQHFLKWSMYLELSRPMGDVDRWKKVYERLQLLNAKYPLQKCKSAKPFHRAFYSYQYTEKSTHKDLKRLLIEEDVVFFGYNAYSTYMQQYKRRKRSHAVDFEVISKEAATCAGSIKTKLENMGYNPIYITTHKGIDEFLPNYYEVRLGRAVLVHIYESKSCYSYNVVRDSELKMNVKIASIETLLSFYLIFYYMDDHYNGAQRIMCMAEALTDLQRKHRHTRTGLLRRFSIECYGTHKTQKRVMQDKYHKLRELKDMKYRSGDRTYDAWFLNYKPTSARSNRVTASNKSIRRSASKGRTGTNTGTRTKRGNNTKQNLKTKTNATTKKRTARTRTARLKTRKGTRAVIRPSVIERAIADAMDSGYKRRVRPRAAQKTKRKRQVRAKPRRGRG